METTLNSQNGDAQGESTIADGAIFVCPGQGSQYPGLLDQWLTTSRANEMCDRWSRNIGLDLRAISRDRESLQDTAIVQPLITATSLLAYEALSRETWFDRGRSCVIGHSVGELAAAAIAGFYSFDTAVRLAGARGRYMSNCCTVQSTGMLALMPSRRNPAPPAEILARAESAPHISIANVNGAGQVVVAGATEALEAFELDLSQGVRAIYLDVAGAFHSPFMEPARAYFDEDLAFIEFSDPPTERPAFFSNKDGARVDSGAELKRRLSAQIVLPVRWDLCMDAASTAYTSRPVIELAPGASYGKLWSRQHRQKTPWPVFSLDGEFELLLSGMVG